MDFFQGAFRKRNLLNTVLRGLEEGASKHEWYLHNASACGIKALVWFDVRR